MGKAVKYSAKVRERAVRMFKEHEHDYPTRLACIESIAGKIGCTAQTLQTWVRTTEPTMIAADSERERVEALEREVAELRRANEILLKLPHISLRWSSTTARNDDGVHRCLSGLVRGRADLRAAADRAIDIVRAQGS